MTYERHYRSNEIGKRVQEIKKERERERRMRRRHKISWGHAHACICIYFNKLQGKVLLRRYFSDTLVLSTIYNIYMYIYINFMFYPNQS